MIRKTINIIVVIALLMNVSCTKYVHIPESEYSGIDGSEEQPARITKTDGTTYIVRKFEIIHDFVIIYEFDNNPHYHDTDGNPDPLPIVMVPLYEITAIEMIEIDKINAATIVGAVAIIVVGGMVAFLLGLSAASPLFY